MFLRVQTIPDKKLIGHCRRMSFSNNQTFELWKNFMPRRKEISNHLNGELISMQVYPNEFDFAHFDPDVSFEKWATVEVSDFDHVPENMATFTIPNGMYAVFLHKGPASDAPKTFGYIFGKWLPESDYVMDQRPHFEILGEKYNKDSAGSEEEIYIPVRLK